MRSCCQGHPMILCWSKSGSLVPKPVYTQLSLTRPFLICHLPLPALPNLSPPSTGLLSSDVAMVSMTLTCTEMHMLGHLRVGACTCIMYMYVCMHVHVHVCISPCTLSYGRIRVAGTLHKGGARIREGRGY